MELILPKRIPVDRKEVLRYMGHREQEVEPAVEEVLEEVLEELLEESTPRFVYRYFPLDRQEEHVFVIGGEGGMKLVSKSLSWNLREASKVCLMACTIGFAMDRLAKKASALGRMSKVVVAQAVGAAMIESVCDMVNDHIKAEALAGGGRTASRFSPGYGDVPLEEQVSFFRLLDIQRKIGVTLTEGNLMLPSKSVTALIGISGVDRDWLP